MASGNTRFCLGPPNRSCNLQGYLRTCGYTGTKRAAHLPAWLLIRPAGAVSLPSPMMCVATPDTLIVSQRCKFLKVLSRILATLAVICLVIVAAGATYNRSSLRHYRKLSGVPGNPLQRNPLEAAQDQHDRTRQRAPCPSPTQFRLSLERPLRASLQCSTLLTAAAQHPDNRTSTFTELCGGGGSADSSENAQGHSESLLGNGSQAVAGGGRTGSVSDDRREPPKRRSAPCGLRSAAHHANRSSGAGFASRTPRAQLAIRASSPSARLVRTIGTFAPTTTPAASAPARY